MKLIIDGSNIVYASLFVSGINNENAVNVSQDTKGMFYHLFLSKLNTYLRDRNPRDIYIAWDSPSGTKYRKSLYPGYKSNRKKQENVSKILYHELLPNLREVLELYPINNFEHEKGEADDVIYSFCEYFKDEDEIMVISGDGDMKQLLIYFDNVCLFSPKTKMLVDKPDKDFVKMKAICGDTSDKVTGVYRIGEKTAPKYISGEKVFNDIQQEQFELSMKLVDLSNYPFSKEILSDIDKYIKNKKYDFNPDLIELFLIENNMKQHYKNWGYIRERIIFNMDNFE